MGKVGEYVCEEFTMNLVRFLMVKLIRAYQLALSPLLGQHCRFHPSCSTYAIEALETHGIFKGTYLAIRRLGKCHPFHPGGFDPVPPNNTKMVH